MARLAHRDDRVQMDAFDVAPGVRASRAGRWDQWVVDSVCIYRAWRGPGRRERGGGAHKVVVASRRGWGRGTATPVPVVAMAARTREPSPAQLVRYELLVVGRRVRHPESLAEHSPRTSNFYAGCGCPAWRT